MEELHGESSNVASASPAATNPFEARATDAAMPSTLPFARCVMSVPACKIVHMKLMVWEDETSMETGALIVGCV
jgi:hypothetical protein